MDVQALGDRRLTQALRGSTCARSSPSAGVRRVRAIVPASRAAGRGSRAPLIGIAPACIERVARARSMPSAARIIDRARQLRQLRRVDVQKPDGETGQPRGAERRQIGGFGADHRAHRECLPETASARRSGWRRRRRAARTARAASCASRRRRREPDRRSIQCVARARCAAVVPRREARRSGRARRVPVRRAEPRQRRAPVHAAGVGDGRGEVAAAVGAVLDRRAIWPIHSTALPVFVMLPFQRILHARGRAQATVVESPWRDRTGAATASSATSRCRTSLSPAPGANAACPTSAACESPIRLAIGTPPAVPESP